MSFLRRVAYTHLAPMAHHLLCLLNTGVSSHHSASTKSDPTTPWSQDPVQSFQASLTGAASTPHSHLSHLLEIILGFGSTPTPDMLTPLLAIIISSSDICIELDFIKHFHKWHIYHLINTMNECIIWCLQPHKLTTQVIWDEKNQFHQSNAVKSQKKPPPNLKTYDPYNARTVKNIQIPHLRKTKTGLTDHLAETWRPDDT